MTNYICSENSLRIEKKNREDYLIFKEELNNHKPNNDIYEDINIIINYSEQRDSLIAFMKSKDKYMNKIVTIYLAKRESIVQFVKKIKITDESFNKIILVLVNNKKDHYTKYYEDIINDIKNNNIINFDLFY